MRDVYPILQQPPAPVTLMVRCGRAVSGYVLSPFGFSANARFGLPLSPCRPISAIWPGTALNRKTGPREACVSIGGSASSPACVAVTWFCFCSGWIMPFPWNDLASARLTAGRPHPDWDRSLARQDRTAPVSRTIAPKPNAAGRAVCQAGEPIVLTRLRRPWLLRGNRCLSRSEEPARAGLHRQSPGGSRSIEAVGDGRH